MADICVKSNPEAFAQSFLQLLNIFLFYNNDEGYILIYRKLVSPAPVPRFLHSAVVSEGLLLVFGGNTHNDTAFSYGAKCYSADFLAYDLACNSWHTLPRPPNLLLDVARYGHATTLHEDIMYVVGGFNGKMLGSVLTYHLGRLVPACSSL